MLQAQAADFGTPCLCADDNRANIRLCSGRGGYTSGLENINLMPSPILRIPCSLSGVFYKNTRPLRALNIQEELASLPLVGLQFLSEYRAPLCVQLRTQTQTMACRILFLQGDMRCQSVFGCDALSPGRVSHTRSLLVTATVTTLVDSC